MIITSRSFEDVVKFKYLRTTLTDENCMHEVIKSKLNAGNAVQSLLSSRLPSRSIKIKIYTTIILPVVL
jgi:hypothetical protein